MTEKVKPDKYAVTKGEIIFEIIWGLFILAVIVVAVCVP